MDVVAEEPHARPEHHRALRVIAQLGHQPRHLLGRGRQIGVVVADDGRALLDRGAHAGPHRFALPAVDGQREQAEADHPDLPELHSRAVTGHALLWTRRETDADFLAVRVGRGPVPALSRGVMRDGGDRKAAAKVRKQLAKRTTLDDMPVVVDIAHTGLVAIAGASDQVDEVAQALILRLCCDHSPAEVSVTAVLGRDRAIHETWLRWLPHTTRRLGGGAPIAVGSAEEALDRIMGPCGLDLGADTQEETALSILAEILAVRARRPGGFLRDAKQRIHAEAS